MRFNLDSEILTEALQEFGQKLDKYLETQLTEEDKRSGQAKAFAMAKLRRHFHEKCTLESIRDGRYPAEYRFLITIKENP